jgi:hypothetical protein
VVESHFGKVVVVGSIPTVSSTDILIDMHTVDKGEVARYMVVAHLIKMGKIVSVPLTENSSYDLIVDSNNKLFRTQVKKGRYHNGALEVSLHSVSYARGKKLNLKKYTSADIDWLIAVDVEHNKFYLLDYTTGQFDGRNSIWLRVEEGKKKRPNTVFASNYEF